MRVYAEGVEGRQAVGRWRSDVPVSLKVVRVYHGIRTCRARENLHVRETRPHTVQIYCVEVNCRIVWLGVCAQRQSLTG